jgi:hypothetical protein
VKRKCSSPCGNFSVESDFFYKFLAQSLRFFAPNLPPGLALKPGLAEPKLGFGFQPGLPGLLLGRAPPARGLPLLVVEGREPSGRAGREKLGRPGLGPPENGPENGRAAPPGPPEAGRFVVGRLVFGR